MAHKDGDYFRVARFGGFQKEDVMRYIDGLEQKLHAQRQAADACAVALRQARLARLRGQEQARLAQRQAQAAVRVQEELRRFGEQLSEAQRVAAEIEKENVHLRRRIRALEGPIAEEAPVVPLEQLTFAYFLEALETEEDVPGG
ncbi:MAG: hypothetical protein LBC83_05980 [Oscillospiraceae bacterium]|jgi:hypothetical protein|nr:hypothetical protein [Oscillospiraceae bacterium]